MAIITRFCMFNVKKNNRNPDKVTKPSNIHTHVLIQIAKCRITHNFRGGEVSIPRQNEEITKTNNKNEK